VLNIDKQSVRPLYEQVIEQFEQLILIGNIKPDEQIPSVRSLSLELSVNPNTIQKAYNELELNHIAYSVPGIGRFVTRDAKRIIGRSFLKKLDDIYNVSYWLALAGIEQSLLTDTVSKAFTDANRHMEKRRNPNDKS
jgi:GntR family transcriptional regulator